MVGADNFAIEAIPFPAGTVFPVHQRLIRDYGIPLLEGLVLQPLALLHRATFLFMAAPPAGGRRHRQSAGSGRGALAVAPGISNSTKSKGVI